MVLKGVLAKNYKNYRKLKIKNYIKNNNFFLIQTGTNTKLNSWIKTEQHLKKIKYNYYNITNNSLKSVFNFSIFNKIKTIIGGSVFLFKNKTLSYNLKKNLLINNFEMLMFVILLLKLNNKIYSTNEIKLIETLNYKNNVLIFNQFKITILKLHIRF